MRSERPSGRVDVYPDAAPAAGPRTDHRAPRAPHRQRNPRITCAACATNTYKVAVTEASNGSVLLHAFCGHTPHEVLGALGLQIGDLFQRRDIRTMTPAERHQLRQASMVSRTQAAVTVLGHEAHVLLQAANKLGDGETLTEDELTRMRVAALKVFAVQGVLCAR